MLSATFSKRKERASKCSTDSSESTSPEHKRVALNTEDSYKDSNTDDAIASDASLNTSLADSDAKLDIMLSKLGKLDIIFDEIKALHSSVGKMNEVIKDLQEDVTKLKNDMKEISTVKKSLKEANKNTELYRATTKEQFTEMKGSFDHLATSNDNLRKEIISAQRQIAEIRQTTTDIEGSVNDSIASYNEKYDANRLNVLSLKNELASLKERNLKFETYDRRENLRFYGIPEERNEDTKEVLYDFLENEANIEDARSIEIQRVHRTGKKFADKPRPILARFLRFPDREAIFSKKTLLSNGFGISPDYPPEVARMRKQLMPKFLEAKRLGRTANFSRREPQKLFIDGIEIPFSGDK